MLIPSKFSGFGHDGIRRACIGGGSGSTTTSYQTNIPEYAKQPFMETVGKASALANAPYQPYTGERTAQFTPLQTKAFESAENMAVSPQLGAGTEMATKGATTSFTSPGSAAQFMSPYMQNVVDVQQREAIRQNQIANQVQQAQAVGRGAFGGSRDALMRAESARNLGTQLGDIQAKGLQAAYEAAQGQFNREQDRMLTGAGVLGDLGAKDYSQRMGITTMQNLFGKEQGAKVQEMLDRGYEDYRTAQEYPYKQLGFLSDILRGTAGTTRTMYEPSASPIQNLIGTGTALYGASKTFAEGGDVDYTQGGVFQGQGPGQEPRDGVELNFAKGGGIDALASRMQYLPPNLLEQKARAAQSNDLKGYLAAKIAEQEQQKIRAGAQAQQALNAPPPQGTVVQQDLANSGIAAVAPESVGQFADGGIVSFANRGEVPLPFDPTMQGLMPYGVDLSALSPEQAQRYLEEEARIRAAQEEQERQGRPLSGAVDKLGMLAPSRVMAGVPRGDISKALMYGREGYGDTAIPPRKPVESVAFKPTSAQYPPPGVVLKSSTPAVTAPQGQPGQVVTSPFAQGTQAALRKADTTAAAPSATPAGARPANLGAIPPGNTRAELAGIDKLIDSTFSAQETGARSVAEAQRKAREEDLRRYNEDMAKLGPLGAEQEARLKKEEEGLAGRKEEAKGHALMQAGLAILAADPKRGLAAAIGTGGQAGLAAYAKDAEKLQAAQDKINDGLDKLGMLRRAESMATGKERRGYESDIRNTEIDLANNLLKIQGQKGQVSIEAKLAGVKMLQEERLKMLENQTYREVGLARASGAGASGQNKVMQEYGDLQTKVLDSLAKNPMYSMETDPNKKAAMFRTELAAQIQLNPWLKPHAAELLGGGAASGQRVVDYMTGK